MFEYQTDKVITVKLIYVVLLVLRNMIIQFKQYFV